MKKVNIAIAVIVVFAAVSRARAEETTLNNLATAGDKISAVDMKNSFSEAGTILDGFFSGAAAKKDSARDEVAAPAADYDKPGTAVNAFGQTAKDLCNAEPSRTGKISSTVRPLAGTPLKAGAAGLQKGDSWVDDFNTVVDYVVNVGDAASDVADDITCGPNGTCTEENNPAALPDHVEDLVDAATCND